jgi:hypothetical protein
MKNISHIRNFLSFYTILILLDFYRNNFYLLFFIASRLSLKKGVKECYKSLH